MDILPIRLLTDEDALFFGSLSVSLAKLYRAGFSVADGIAFTAPVIKLKTTLEHFDFSSKELFQESILLVNKEIRSIPIPEILNSEIGKHNDFLFNSVRIKGIKNLWFSLLDYWLTQIKHRLWNKGFYTGIAEGLEPVLVNFVKNPQVLGVAYFDELQDDVNIAAKSGKLHPNDLKKIVDIVYAANKKLFFSFEYEWIIDGNLKITRVLPYTPPVHSSLGTIVVGSDVRSFVTKTKSAVKIFPDLSTGSITEKNIDGVFIDSEKIFDLNLPSKSFEQVVVKLVESAISFPALPVYFKLADKSEGMGKLRGTLRLLHQRSLFDPLMQALDFVRHKKLLNNVHIVVPFLRTAKELHKIKTELAARKLSRKTSLQLWMEVAVPENIINLGEYLEEGIDGIFLNLDELLAHLGGFDPREEQMGFYKNEVDGMLRFLEDGIKILHKSGIPFIAHGSLAMQPKVLEYLVEKGVYGVVVERYDSHSAKDLLYQTEKRLILTKS